MVDFLEKNNPAQIKENILTAVAILGGLLILSFLKPIALNFTDFQFWRASNKIQISLYGMVLAKATRYNTLNASLHPSGRILNYVQVDVPKYEMYFPTLFSVVNSLLMTVCNYVYMFLLIDWSTIIVIVTVITSNLVLMVLYKLRLNIRFKLLDVKDDRLDFFKNVVKNLKYIKMRAWENFYYFRIF